MRTLNIISWFDKNTIKHLRIPFSFYLMPVFLFALSQAAIIDWAKTISAFVILHLFIFPSSNGYNSYQDRDETSIGGLKHPPKVTKNLYRVTLLFDILAVAASLFISVWFSILILLFVTVSRAYSYRNIRLKKYPFLGFLTVFLFQGAFVYAMAISAISGFHLQLLLQTGNLLCMSISSMFIGSMYPLTQIYQHEADKKDGVISISYKLGYNGTFLFSSVLFIVASILMYYYFNLQHQAFDFAVFILLMTPVILRLMIWANKVRKDTANANFENTMTINNLTSACMNLYFLLLIFNSHYNWF